MRRIGFAALVGLSALLAGPGLAREKMTYADTLMTEAVYFQCNEHVKRSDGDTSADQYLATICLSSLNWFRLGVLYADILYNGNSSSLIASKKIFGCPVNELSNDVLARVFVKGVKEDPKLMALAMPLSMQEIMNREFPCK